MLDISSYVIQVLPGFSVVFRYVVLTIAVGGKNKGPVDFEKSERQMFCAAGDINHTSLGDNILLAINPDFYFRSQVRRILFIAADKAKNLIKVMHMSFYVRPGFCLVIQTPDRGIGYILLP